MRAVKLCIAVAFAVVRTVRAGAFLLAGIPVSPTFVVLMYHSVKRGERDRFARQMDRLLKLAKPVPADFVCEGGRGRGNFVAVTFDDGYASVAENALPVIVERGIPASLFVPTKYLGGRPDWIRSPGSRDAAERILSAGELIRVSEMRGVVIGSHSLSHRPLAEISQSEAFAELVESRGTLERLLGRRVGLCALPYGSSSPAVLRLSKQAGYERVFLGSPLSLARSVKGHVAGRIGVSPGDWPLEFRLKVRGAYDWLPVAIAAKGKVRSLLRRSQRISGDAVRGTEQ